MSKTIEFYNREVYGNLREYVANEGDANIIYRLTGKKTITSVERELIRDLSGGLIHFKQILPPSKSKWGWVKAQAAWYAGRPCGGLVEPLETPLFRLGSRQMVRREILRQGFF